MRPQLSYYRESGDQASGTITVSAAPTAGDKVTIDSVDYTFGTHFFGNTLKLNEIAYAMACCINADPSTYGALHTSTNPCRKVFALAYGPIVRVIAVKPGTGGNSLTLTTSAAAVFAVSGGTLAGGAA